MMKECKIEKRLNLLIQQDKVMRESRDNTLPEDFFLEDIEFFQEKIIKCKEKNEDCTCLRLSN